MHLSQNLHVCVYLTFDFYCRASHVYTLYVQSNVCVLLCVCLKSPSNQSFYRQITGHGMSIGDHRVA